MVPYLYIAREAIVRSTRSIASAGPGSTVPAIEQNADWHVPSASQASSEFMT
jgi:hypothetical protein